MQLPKVQSDKSALHFTSDFLVDQLTLSVVSGPALEFYVSYQPEWLHVASGVYITNSTITVYANASTLLPQIITDKIVITTPTGELIIPVTFNITTTNAVRDPSSCCRHENSARCNSNLT